MRSPRRIDVNIVPSARGIQAKLAKELQPVSGIAAAEGSAAGAALGGNFTRSIDKAGIASTVERQSTKAAGTGERILSRFALRTGGLFQQLDRQLGSFGGPFTGSLTTIGTSLRTVALGEKNAALGANEFQRVGTAAYLGLGLAAVGFGAVSIKAALGAEQAHAQLQQAVHATGHSFEDISGSIGKAVEKLAKFGFDQEEVDAALAKLTRASRDPQKALELIGVAADIARAKNLDLGSASQILVNIEAGRVRGLAQLGISTKDSAGNTIKAEEAVRRITALYGGAATASAKTYAGQLQAVGATAHNLEEEIGGKLLPVVAEIGTDLLAGVHGFEAANRATGGWLGTLAGAAFVGGAVAVTVSKVSSGVSKLITLFGVQTAATEAVTAAEVAQVAVTEADVVAQGELAAASGTAAVAMEGEAASAGVLSTQLTGLAAPLAALAIGFIAGKKAGDEINGLIGGAAPNVEKLTASLIELEKHPLTGTINAKKFAEDIGGQVGKDAISPIKGIEAVFSRSAHKAHDDVKALNAAFKSILQTEGVDKANLAFGLFTKQFAAAGGNVKRLAGDMEPFFAAMDLASAKADTTSDSVKNLAGKFQDLAKSFSADAARLGIQDAIDTAKTAVEDLGQLKLDAIGQGQKSIDAAHAEQQAQQSLRDAYRSQTTAASNLADARAKLAQFDSSTDQRIRGLERQQITDRVVTTPEEARQKEIDLLKFDEDATNKRQDLQRQVATAEAGVQSATEGVAKAQQGVSDAAKARRQIQVDAAAAIAGAERKAQEAILGAGKALVDANIAGQLGAGNIQLDLYVQLLDDLSKTLDPNSQLTKNLNDFLVKASMAAAIKAQLGPAPPQGPGGAAFTGAPPAGPASAPAPRPSGAAPPAGPSAPNVKIADNIHFHGADQPTTRELDTLNRKQAIRLAASGVR